MPEVETSLGGPIYPEKSLMISLRSIVLNETAGIENYRKKHRIIDPLFA
jgi:hypothetical protein